MLSFWTIQPGDPIKIRNNHWRKELHNLEGTACEKPHQGNGYGAALRVVLTKEGRLIKTRISCESIVLLPKEPNDVPLQWNPSPSHSGKTQQDHTSSRDSRSGEGPEVSIDCRVGQGIAG